MKCCIIINAFRIPRESVLQAERIKTELELLGVQTQIIADGWSRLCVKDGELKADIDADFIIYLDKDKYLSASLTKLGYRLFNSHDAIRVCDDKAETYIALSNNGVNLIDTVFGALCFNSNGEILPSAVDRIESVIGYPVIIKESYGSMGKGVYKADDRAGLKKVMEQVKLKPHLYQKFIPTAVGKDVRIIVIGCKAVACMERYNTQDFRSNIAQGGNGRAITPRKAYVDLAERVARLLGLDYCGVDLLYGENDEPILCEVNSNAFFLGMEKATGINVAKLYAEYLIAKLNQDN